MKKFLNASAMLGLFILMAIVFNACQKDVATENTSGLQKVMVYLNDDPSLNFTKVLVDIRYVEVKIDSSHGSHHDHDADDDHDDDHHGHDDFGYWDTLAVAPGIYDLLQLRNGVDTLLATGFVGHGRITKLRFTLGDNNEVWTDSTTAEPLGICDNRHYIYAKLPTNSIDTLPGGQAIIRIDFNVERSIKKIAGHYCLLPVLKPYCHSRSGGIEGKIYPSDAVVLIKAYSSTDTAYAIPWHHGEFKIRGLNEGTYTVLYDALSPYQDTTISNVQVYRGRDTELPDVTLHP